MIYRILKPFIRLALKIYCPQMIKGDVTVFESSGPLLITANHPNSFLDAIIIASLFKNPIHFLARGDAFKKPWHHILLRTLHMFPVYRLSEGKENLALNAFAFEKSRNILSKNGIVLIFIEGICVNKHALQPFKKGAARIAYSCWKNQVPLRVLPLGIAYNSFIDFGKAIQVQAGEPLTQNQLMPFEEEPRNYVFFNEVLNDKISTLISIPQTKPVAASSSLLLPLFILGNFLHRPLFGIVQKMVRNKTNNTVFYDSVLFGVLLLIYPVYLLLFALLLNLLQVPALWILVLIILHPLTAWLLAINKITKTNSIDN